MDNLCVKTPGSKYCHFPKRDDYGAAYFTGLLSEHLTYKSERKQPWIWEKIPGHERNEPLDCRNYAMAAFKSLSVNLDEIDRKLTIARGECPAQPVTAIKTPSRNIKKAPKKRLSLKDYYDNW